MILSWTTSNPLLLLFHLTVNLAPAIVTADAVVVVVDLIASSLVSFATIYAATVG